MGFAITTNGRINDMVEHGRANESIRKTYDNINVTHDNKRKAYYNARTKADEARNNAAEAREAARSISFFEHPILRMRANRRYRSVMEVARTMSLKAQAARSEYKTATLDLRDMRRTIREEHRASNSFDRNIDSLKKNIAIAKELGIIVPHNILEAANRNPGMFSLKGDKRSFLNPDDGNANRMLKQMISQKRSDLKDKAREEKRQKREAQNQNNDMEI